MFCKFKYELIQKKAKMAWILNYAEIIIFVKRENNGLWFNILNRVIYMGTCEERKWRWRSWPADQSTGGLWLVWTSFWFVPLGFPAWRTGFNRPRFRYIEVETCHVRSSFWEKRMNEFSYRQYCSTRLYKELRPFS